MICRRAADFLRKALSLPGDEQDVLASLDRVLRKLEALGGAGRDPRRARPRSPTIPTSRPISWPRSATRGCARSTTPRGRWSRIAARSSARPSTRGRTARCTSCSSGTDTREGALEILEPLADARGDYRELVSLYEHRLTLHEDHAERAHWLRRIAEVYDGQLGDSARAIEALGRALAEEPAAGAALDEIERIAGAAKIPLEAARLIEAVLERAEPDAARELALRAAHLYEQSPGEGAAAERLYVRVLETDPENVDALTALESYYRAAADAARTAAILERRAAIEFDPQARKRLLMEASGLHERLGAIPEAITALQTLRAAEEGDADVLGELARLYEATRPGRRARPTCSASARGSPRRRPSAPRCTRASARSSWGCSAIRRGAADAYREALESAPEDPTSLAALETIAERLRRLVDAAGRADAASERGVGARSGAGAAEAGAQRRAEAEGSRPEHRVPAPDPRGRPRQRPGVPGARAAAGRRRALVRPGRRVRPSTPTPRGPRGARPPSWRCGSRSPTSGSRSSTRSRARPRRWRRCWRSRPITSAALLSLARLHEGAERWDEAGEALERAAGRGDLGPRGGGDPVPQRPDPARTQARRPKRSRPGCCGRWRATRPTGRRCRRWRRWRARRAIRIGWCRSWSCCSRRSTDDAERKARIAEIASLYRGPLGRAADAIPYLEQLIELDPANITPREELSEALLGAGRIDEAAQLMLQIIEQLTKARRGKDVARYQQRLGVIAESRGDFVAAAESFNAAYKLDPSHAGTLAALGRLALRENDVERARKFYRSLLLQNFDEASAGVSKAEVYLALGQIHVMAREIPKARNMFERGLENDPKNEQLRQALASLTS